MKGPSLLEVLAEVPGPRGRRGRRHPLPAVLGLTTGAIPAGAKRPEAIAQFGRDHGPPLYEPLGFRFRPPCKATLSDLFRKPDVAAFEAALTRWVAGRAGEAEVVPIDGKHPRCNCWA